MIKTKNLNQMAMQHKKHLIHVTSSLRVGGAETVLCDLVQGLQNQFEQTVIYIHDGPKRKIIESMGVQTYQVKGLLSTYDPLFFIRLYLLLKKLKPDIVHSLLWAANVGTRIIGKLLGLKVVSAYHNNVDQDGAFRNFCDRKTIAWANTLIAVSGEVEQSIRHNAPNYHNPINVIKNGINPAEIVDKATWANLARTTLDLDNDHCVIGSVGRFEPVKNYSLLLESFALVHAQEPKARLVLVGQGAQEQMLREQVRSLGLQQVVIFVVGQAAYGYYPLFDVFVQSSDKEGVSMALLEAMSCAVPCVSTNSDVQHSVLEHRVSGLIVPAGDAIALSQALLLVIRDKTLGQKLIMGARAALEKDFTHQAMLRSYSETLLDVIQIEFY